MDRKDKYIERVNAAPISKRIKAIKAMETYKVLGDFFNGFSVSVDSFTKILEEVFPDKWDIVVKRRTMLDADGVRVKRKKRPFRIEVIIHFPKIEITNKKNMSHLIQDLYIKLTPTRGYKTLKGMTFNGFKGKRMTASKKEIFGRYQHSHLSSRDYKFTYNNDCAFSWREFCLGSSEIKQVLSMMEASYSDNIFKLFLLQLEEYVNYESIEGNPYTYIENIIGGGKLPTLAKTVLVDYLKKLNERVIKPELDFTIRNGEVRIQDNDKLEEYIKLFSDRDLYNVTLVSEKDVKGNYFAYKNTSGTIPDRLLGSEANLKRAEFTFKGETIKFKVTEDEGDNANKPFYIHKRIKDYVTEEIEQGIKTKRFRSFITKQLNTSNNQPKYSRQDRVFVPEN